jgi:adenylate cyclase, class 2
MRNLELKVRCHDSTILAAIQQRAQEHGATYLRTMQQRDTYFPVPAGRLKLREWSREDDTQATPPGKNSASDLEVGRSGAILVAYTRPDDASSRMSEYIVSPVTDSESMRTALKRVLGTLVVVDKSRVLYLYGATRIHLDTVQELGTFVELETMIEKTTSIEEATAEHNTVIALLELDKLPIIASSYSNLLLDKQEL